ncbi:MAG: AAA family ATPase [Gammaproteobacteria bacterium]|nr:AAA family ATPase [Gammaproteobacteria bacterium]
MVIRNIKIRNFRGIKELDWALPAGEIFCLIGKGDSAKSTILEAIRYAFHPQWNLLFTDSDFFQCKTDQPIIIEVSIGNLVEGFIDLNRYGKYLRGWNLTSLEVTDEPDDHLERILTVQLTVESDLEPKWQVVCDRNPEGVDFKTGDRNKVGVGMIGVFSEKQLSWSNGTALAKLTETQNLNESLVNATRTARSSLDSDRAISLKNFDEAAQKAQVVAKSLGVPVLDVYKAHLDLNSINIKIGGLSLHDGEIPLRQLGLGSRRMLLCGIQQNGLVEGHITLIDEIEFGLEPHRIARLIKHIRQDQTGQYFITTHSPTVLRELNAKELYFIQNKSGVVKVISATQEVQGKLRSSPEAFLAKKVVVCEGATEIGFLRGFDDYQLNQGKDPFSYHGIALLNASGSSNIKGLAVAFNSFDYPVAVLADGDAPKNFSIEDENYLTALGVKVHVWADLLSLERRAMMDLPWEYVLLSVKLARDEFNRPVHKNLETAFNSKVDEDFESWVDNTQWREAIGQAAAKSEWFKDITRGDLWFKTIAPALNDPEFMKSNLAVTLNNLWGWIEDDR